MYVYTRTIRSHICVYVYIYIYISTYTHVYIDYIHQFIYLYIIYTPQYDKECTMRVQKNIKNESKKGSKMSPFWDRMWLFLERE